MKQYNDKRWWRGEYPEKDWRVFEDFRYFLILVWRHLMLPDPTWVQYDIASYLQGGPRRLIIEAFRGVGKSWITSAYVCWRLLRNPQRKIMVVSASKERADQFSTFTLRLINEMPLLQHLMPQADQRQSKIAFDVGPARADHSPSVKSVGIFGQLTGGRADEIIADDVEVPNNSETQSMRDKLAERVKEFDAVLKPGGMVKYLGTPQTEESLYNELPQRGYEVRIWPARVPTVKVMKTAYGSRISPKIVEQIDMGHLSAGDPTDSARFDDEDLMEREASYGRSGFALQFMLDTSLSDQDKYPLKLADLIVTGINNAQAPENIVWSGDPQYILKELTCVGLNGDRYHRPAAMLGDWIAYEGSVLAIDPSGRGKDETTYAVVKMLNGFLYVTEAGGMQGGYDDTVMEELAQVAKRNKCNYGIIESNFGDGMFTRLFTPFLKKVGYSMTVEEVRHNTQKERRIIDVLEPVMNQHRLIMDIGAIQKDADSTKHYPPEQALKRQLMYQMSRITKDRGALAYDDRLDALAMAVAYWVEQMGQDEEDKMDQRQEQLQDAELSLWHGEHGISIDVLALGGTPEQAMKAALMGGFD
ncbi:phage terminase large subunit [Epibacterium sp. MM17-32]|uniref:phage terminase large subunit n=1 Tax=Epibacterium sp. MM17-32 TaxID=2917734 RepID=UPI001EF56CDA|nr:phage terminase large subunit [Epibacterium sp. MM17-32]MCG7628399.1 phage terminase large subunit [Epibacterium sp. MM17-32]